MGPIDYTIDVENPLQAGLQGFQGGLSIIDVMRQRVLQQQEIDLRRRMQDDFIKLSENPNPTGKDFAGMMIKYPQLSQHFKASWDVLSSDQQRNKLQEATQIHAALLQGRPEVADALLENQVAAFENVGDYNSAKAAETFRKLIELDPEKAKATSGLMLSSIMGVDKYAGTFNQLGIEQREMEKHPFEVAKTASEAQQSIYNSQIKEYEASNAPQKIALENSLTRAQIQDIDDKIQERSERLSLDKDKLKSDIEMEIYKLDQKNTVLNDDSKKLINDSVVAASVANQAATNMLVLADKLDASSGATGAFGKGVEIYKNLTGNQNAVTHLKQEYLRLRNQTISAMLKGQGQVTDYERNLFMKGFPPENANPRELAKFMRVLAKAQEIDAALNSAKAEWVSSVGSLAKSKKNLSVAGINIPAGTNFDDFTSEYMSKIVEERLSKKSLDSIKDKSYMKYAE